MSKKSIDYGALMMSPVFEADTDSTVTDPIIPTLVTVTLDQLVPFDKNPRKTKNPKYEEIKESIRSIGLRQIINVTRQSPQDPYMVRDGGNTRLQILNELYEEAKKDPEQNEQRFYNLKCMFYPYANTGYIDFLAGHMSENEERGQTLFIERAIAATQFKEHFTQQPEFANGISNRELSRQISNMGWSINDSNLTQMLYANDVLLPIIPNALWNGIGVDRVKKIRKLISDGSKLWAALANKSDPNYSDIWQPAFKELDVQEYFDLDEALLALERNIAKHLGCSIHSIQAELQAVIEGAPPPTERPQEVLATALNEENNPALTTTASVTSINPENQSINSPNKEKNARKPKNSASSKTGIKSHSPHPDTEGNISQSNPDLKLCTDSNSEPNTPNDFEIDDTPRDSHWPLNRKNYVFPNSATCKRYARPKDDGDPMPIMAMLEVPIDQFFCEWHYYGGGYKTRVKTLKQRVIVEIELMTQLWAINDAVTPMDAETLEIIEAPVFQFNEYVVERVLKKYDAVKGAFFQERNYQDPEVHLRWRQLGILMYLSDLVSFCMEDFAWNNPQAAFQAFPNFNQIDPFTTRMARSKINEIRALGSCPASEDIFHETAFYMGSIEACMGRIMDYRIHATKNETYLAHGFPID